MLTVQYARALPEFRVNAVEPGFTATDLTGSASQTVAEGAELIVRLATIGKDGPIGTFQENAGELAWRCRITAQPLTSMRWVPTTKSSRSASSVGEPGTAV
jgi:NAD(P)-dependent dehydrogenase (short-subunit alcohol dehydrogenase family)